MWMLHTGTVFPTAGLPLFRKPSPNRACVCGHIHTQTKYIFKSFRGFCSFFLLIILTKASSVPRHFFWLWPNSPFVSYLLDLGVFLYFTPSRDSFGAPALAPTPPTQLQQRGLGRGDKDIPLIHFCLKYGGFSSWARWKRREDGTSEAGGHSLFGTSMRGSRTPQQLAFPITFPHAGPRVFPMVRCPPTSSAEGHGPAKCLCLQKAISS